MRSSRPWAGRALAVAVALVAVSLWLTASRAEARRRTRPKHAIKFATIAPEGSTWLNIMRELDKELYERTGGKLGFRIYAGGVSGDEKDVLRKIRIGQLHAAGFTGVGMGEILPEIRILDLPFLFFNYDEVDHVLSRMRETFEAKFLERGFVLLGWAEVGFVHFFSKEPIRTQADLKARKLWVWQDDPLALAYFKALGVSPTPLAVTDVLTSLQTDLIDTVYTSPLGMIALQWHTKVSFMSALPMADAAGAVLVDRRVFERLSPEHQKLLKELTPKYMRRLVLRTREDNARSVEVLRSRGLTIVPPPPPEQLESFLATGREAQDSLAGELFSRELLDEVRRAVEEYRRAHPGSSLAPVTATSR